MSIQKPIEMKILLKKKKKAKKPLNLIVRKISNKVMTEY